MRALILVVAAGFGLLQTQPGPVPAAAPPPGTDIYLVPLTGGVTGGLASMKSATPVPMSVAAGYDNQPMFSPDGARVLFAANRDGKQIDIYSFDRASGRITQLTQTAENENSPTFVPVGIGAAGSFSVVQTEPDRSQRLWRFDAAGKNPQLVLAEVKPVGYHAWVEPDHLALFILGQPATLQVGRVATGKADVVARDIGRSLHRLPGTRRVSFVQREAVGLVQREAVGLVQREAVGLVQRDSPTEFWIKDLDIDSRQITPLVRTVAGSSDRDYAWMPDGRTIVMSAGSKVWSWTRGAAGWSEVFDGAAHQLLTITRLAVSPQGDAVALVVAEPRKP